jgi:hypothetical protein
MGARGAASHGELNLSDMGGGNLPKVAGHGGTWLAGGGGGELDGGRSKGRRRKAMDRSERVPSVARSSGIWLDDRRRARGSYPQLLDEG